MNLSEERVSSLENDVKKIIKYLFGTHNIPVNIDEYDLADNLDTFQKQMKSITSLIYDFEERIKKVENNISNISYPELLNTQLNKSTVLSHETNKMSGMNLDSVESLANDIHKPLKLDTCNIRGENNKFHDMTSENEDNNMFRHLNGKKVGVDTYGNNYTDENSHIYFNKMRTEDGMLHDTYKNNYVDERSCTNVNEMRTENNNFKDICMKRYDYEDPFWYFDKASNNIVLKDKETVHVTEDMFIHLMPLLSQHKEVSMHETFKGCYKLISVRFPVKFCRTRINSMKSMFFGCTSLMSIVFPKYFDTKNVKSMKSMFHGCCSLTTISFPDSFSTINVESMQNMFYGCSAIRTLRLPESFDTSNVLSMQSMFGKCSLLESISFPDTFTAKSCTDLQSMFESCEQLSSIEFPDSFSTANVITMKSMFSGCKSLDSITFSSLFDTSQVKNMRYMFYKCSSLKNITLYTPFIFSRSLDDYYMLRGTQLTKSEFRSLTSFY